MKIVVLAGGLSTERMVSLVSGTEACKALRRRGHKAILVDMFLGLEQYKGSIERIFDVPDGLCSAVQVETAEPNLAMIRRSRRDKSPSQLGQDVMKVCAMADIVFLGLHGESGEDGRIQATLDLLGIPYTGSGYLASGMAMDKAITKRVMEQNGIPTARWRDLTYGVKDVERLTEELFVPCAVKVATGGSSLGVFLPDTREELRHALNEVLKYGDHVVIEEKIRGRELTVGVLGERALPAVEIIPNSPYFDYVAKYQDNGASEICPANLTEEQAEHLGELALTLHRALGLTVYSRSDFLMDEAGNIYCLEVNTLPGITPNSLIPREAAAVGIPYEEFCEAIVLESLRVRNLEREHCDVEKGAVDMLAITVAEIEKATGGQLLAPGRVAAVGAVCTDSRQIEKGCLFVPWQGEIFDGHDFIDAALHAGAAGVICAKVPEVLQEGKFYIQVVDTRLALRDLAAWYRDKFSIPFIQITGSVGKTTTKEMVAAVLSAKFNVLKTPKNFNNDIGTPLTLFQLTPEHEVAVIETGMNHFGEIRYLGEMLRPDMAIICNIGDAHVEYLGSREGILQGKCEIFDNLKSGGLAILNGDDAMLGKLKLPFETLRCGKTAACNVTVCDIVDHGLDGVSCRVATEKDTYPLTIYAPGEHMVYSASQAVVIGERLGMSKEEIIRGVASYTGVDNRMNILRLAGARILLDDCYNASPQSVAAGLEVLAKSEGSRKLAVLGDMAELGDLTEQAHYNIGALAAMLGIDLVVAIGKKAEKIAEGCRANGGAVIHFEEKTAAHPELLRQFVPGTVALVKASHFSMHFETIVNFLKEQSYTE